MRIVVVTAWCAVGLVIGLATANTSSGANRGTLEIRVVDKETGEPVAVRMHLKDQKGKPVKVPKVPNWNDHFVFGQKIVLDLPLGAYTFEVERGLEYRELSGNFVLERGASDSKVLELTRFVDMKKEGWWSGDLHVTRPAADIESLMLGEDIHVAPVISWSNEKPDGANKQTDAARAVEFGEKRFYQLMAGEDAREGGCLHYFNLPAPLPLANAKREFPSPADFLKQAKRHELCHVDVERPYAWDLPVWLASKRVNSISVAHSNMLREGMGARDLGGKPRDNVLFPLPHGDARWSTHIYYQLLNCGLRIPPSAGSGSGIGPNPVGYNRMYVHCGETMSWENWWAGFKAGRMVVTNGPMLRPLVNGELPGHVFQANAGESVELSIALNLAMREKVDYLEIIKDGLTLHEVRLDEFAKKNGQLPLVKFDRSGWLIVRAVTNNPKTYRFAMSAPYYVEIGGQPTISRKAAQFFLDWVTERAKRVKLDDAEQRESVIRYHRAARDYWQRLLENANAE